MDDYDRLDKVIRHIENVQNACRLLGEKLIEKGDVQLGRLLIANGYIHDNSKFHGVEWDYLDEDNDERQKIAISHHNRTNPHHPEYWGGIKLMPPLFIAEMVCDWKARANEFGTSLVDWIIGDAAKRYKYTKDDEIYKAIKYFAEMLCDKPFKQLKLEEEVLKEEK